MSILDALRLQRSEQNSVRDLAMLPQAQIVQLAQSGQIPAEVVPIIINEKARMAQQAAQMQAAQQQPQPTVIEQAMAQNAQAETPMNGVAAIPTQMFQPQNFQTGGIVAFQGGGATDPFFERTEATPEYTPPGAAVGSIDAYIQEAAARRAEARKPTEAMLALERALVAPGRTDELRREARNMAMLQAGLGILSGTSPYALQNIGRGAAPAAEAYGRQMGDIRRQEREGIAQRAALDARKQEQALADIAAGESAFSASRKEALEDRKITSAEERERIRAASAEERERTRAESAEKRAGIREEGLAARFAGPRVTDRAGYVQTYVQAALLKGDKRPEAIIALEGQNQYNALEARTGLQEDTLRNQILGEIDKEIAAQRRDPSSQQRRAEREFVAAGSGSADDFWAGIRERRINERYAELAKRGASISGANISSTRSVSAPSAQPPKPDIKQVQGAPAGSTIGQFVPGSGWEVVKDGKVLGYVGE